MNEDIQKNIISQSDDALIEMIINQTEYTIEAINVAEEEIKRRNIDTNYLQIIKERINAKRHLILDNYFCHFLANI